MREHTLTRRLLGLAFLGSAALASCTNPKSSGPVITNTDTTTVANIESNAEFSSPDTTLVVHLGNDTEFSFLTCQNSQPYMTIRINMNGEIMTYWGDEESRVTLFVSIDELKQTILERFNAGDTPKESELFHVVIDMSTPKSVLLALKDMFLEIGVHQCEWWGCFSNPPREIKITVPLSSFINIAETNVEILRIGEDQTGFVEITDDTTQTEDDEKIY